MDAALLDFPMLRRTEGKMVFELRPEVDWHKGKAVEWLLGTIKEDYPDQDILAIYIGDDTTDEDAFRSLKPAGGVGIIVREDVPRADETDACYCVADTREVAALLQKFVDLAPELGNKAPKPPEEKEGAQVGEEHVAPSDTAGALRSGA